VQGHPGTLWFAELSAGELGSVRFCRTVPWGAVTEPGPVSGELSGSPRSASKIVGARPIQRSAIARSAAANRGDAVP
jgi:hypothetical protein